MDFTTLRTQVMALLQGEGRVAYRALKLQFQLDDDTLEALKDDLIYAKRLAVDEEGRVLVWAGGTSSAPTTASPGPPPATPDVSPTRGDASPVVPPTPEAERRQLTVLFCDLVDSTRLSSQLDPEEYRDVVRAYQTACTAVIQRYDGHIAQLLGDGLLVYFGYPQAHEDDAHRAVRTGLAIIDAVGTLNTQLEQDNGIRLAVRVGLHTGLVVVGQMGSHGRQEQLALGEVPNVCARLQGLAEPNTVALSAATYRLIQGYFECQALGAHTLRGVAEPLAVYRVLSESGAQSRLDIARAYGLTPMVGREQEVGLLLARWAEVKAGHGHVVLLTGDAGIGKSRLVHMLKEHVAHEPHVRWECRSVPYYQNTTLYPLTDLLQRTLQWQQDETPDEKLSKLERTLRPYRLPLEETVSLFAPLLSLTISEERYPPLLLSPQRQRQKTLETMVAMLLELAEHQPVLFILEDLHWTDPTTLEWLNLLIDQTPTASMLVLLTCRPHFQLAWHHRSYLTEITVHRLSHAQVAQIVAGMTDGKTFPTAVLQQIIAKTDGVPLFIEELTKAILESGHLTEVDGHYELTKPFSTFTIPATLQDSLMARLDRLVTAKGIAQMGATLGRQFAYELLHAVAQVEASTLQRELGRLVEAEIVYQRGLPPQATYMFKHALIQDAAYQSLLKSTRQQYHQRIAQVLEEQFPETAEAEPELLAHHLTEAELSEQAVAYWHKAAQRVVEHSAHVEAIAHLRQGLALLQTRPQTPERTQRTVDMLIALGASLIATKSYAAPEVGQTYREAQQLCASLNAAPALFPILRGLWMYALARAQLHTAHALSQQLLALAQQGQDPAMLIAAHRAGGSTLFYLGAGAEAQRHFTHGIALSEPQQHRASTFLYGEDAGAMCGCYAALTLWLLGYPDQGRRQMDAAMARARQTAYPFSVGVALCMAAIFHTFRREWPAAQAQAEAAIRLTQEQGFPLWMLYGSLLRVWTLVQQGHAPEGITQLTQGVSAVCATGTTTLRPYLLALLAEAHGILGQPEAGLTVLTDALTQVATTGERWYEAELYRLQGALLLQQSPDHGAEAEASFHYALGMVRQQQAKSLELRAATSLARLWQRQGKRAEAHALLAPVYGWFTEGFDTADLQEARALLDELG
jgi:class 3 adenylate cyclase/predicted ATPase